MANNGAVNALRVMDLRPWELALNVFFPRLSVSFLPCSHFANLPANVKRVWLRTRRDGALISILTG